MIEVNRINFREEIFLPLDKFIVWLFDCLILRGLNWQGTLKNCYI